MSKKATVKVEVGHAKGIEYTRKPDTPHLFIDGASEALVGFPLSKLTLHVVTGVSPDGKERRESVAQLHIPTGALMEMCRNILAQGAAVGPHLDTIFEQSKEHYRKVIEGVEITPVSIDQ